ncbi:Testis-expressed sequence 10 protein [Rhizoctonia solani]|uniref:Pre-rRNA-processing protein n=1 Tax=Rhizoctonia solani TaxID=456999 RepID=A0A8H8P6K5_9AGAM|nr:Testis-expressed sequence 10 protein [Rhizoctonia solani]QRW24482.1 Testis-expressed sequence 10 protein [Rhizoctonia solani]
MPKSSKKRKEKAADFAKAKLKLGKGKKAPSNEIDTSFKARSVALPNQTIRTEEQVAEQGIPTTRRRLTYDDLLIHLRHYSPGTRKDALQGLRELLGNHQELIIPNLGSLLDAISKLIADDDHSVRKSLISFLEWVLDQIPTATLIPHAPPLLLFAAAALAHISAPVRADSVRIISVLLARVPHAVVSGTGLRGAKAEGPGARILDGLMDLAVADSRGVGSDQSLSNSTKSTLLATLSMFLQHALAISPTFDRPDSSIPTWFFASSFPSNTAFDSFIALLSVRKANGMQRKGRYVELNKGELMAGPMDFDLDILDPDETLESNASNKSESEVPLLVLVTRLHPLLTATFLDNAPQLSLPTSMTSQSLELVLSVVELARLVYGALIRDGDTREGLQTLNLAYAELVSLNISRTLPTDSAIRRRNKKGSKPRTDGQQIDEVASYVVRTLRGEVGSTPGLPSALSLIAYTSLLPTLWALRSEKDVIPATMQHAASGSGAGHKNVKRAAVEFMGRSFCLDNAEVMEWVLGLPRTAWEFGEKDPRGTELVLLILLRMNQRKLYDDPTLNALRQRLIPFFIFDHAKRGTITGPWTKLPDHLQRLALDVMSSLCHDGGDVRELTNAVDRAVAQTTLAEYWVHVRPHLKV